MKNNFARQFAGLILLLILTAKALAQNLDYGAMPTLTKPQSDQMAANQKLDYHTDLFTGRFNYKVPIEMPPGRGGSEPAIALQYNSSGGNGWCGVGWDLDMGYIQRDTRHGSPVSAGGYYSDSNGFIYSFAGQSGRLVLASDGTYRPEINAGFLKFVYANGYWIVTDKSGRQFSFGGTTASRIDNPFGWSGGTFKWALSAIQDADGNQTTFTYQTLLGLDKQLYLYQINYNSSANDGNLSANCTVQFGTVNRSDVPVSCLSGQQIPTAHLLQDIWVNCNSQQVRHYVLNYTTSPSTGRSLLTSIQEYGTDIGSVWPSTTFTYSALSKSFRPTQRWPITSQAPGPGDLTYTSPSTVSTALIDMNGDGLPDWVSDSYYASMTYLVVQTNTGSGFGPAQHWQVSNETGDTSPTWNSVDQFEVPFWAGGKVTTCKLVDINGDGLPDRVLTPGGSGMYFQVQTNTGNGFGPIFHWTGISTNDWYSAPEWAAPGSALDPGNYWSALIVDMNGDGVADLVMLNSGSNSLSVGVNKWPTSASFYMDVWTLWTGVVDKTGRGAGLRAQFNIEGILSDFMDLNGDGLPDRIFPGGVQLNKGFVWGFDNPQPWGLTNKEPFAMLSTFAPGYQKQVFDINGDGLPDLVTAHSNGTYSVQYNTGSGFSGTPVTWTSIDTNAGPTSGLQSWDPDSTMSVFIDLNGDGLPDRVVRNNEGGSDCLLVQLNAGPYPDLMITASNGIGGEVDISYTNSTVFDNTDGTRARVPFPVRVATSVVLNGHMGSSMTNCYSYRYGLYDTTWREFRGFGMVRESLPTGMGTFYTNITYFHQGGGKDLSAQGEYQDSRFKAGMPFDALTFGADGNLYKETRSQITQVQVDPNGVYFPFATNVFEFDAEPSSGIRATLKQFTYAVVSNNLAASTGNLIQEAELGEVTNAQYNYTFTDLPDSPVYTTYVYTNLSNSNIIDKPATVTVSADPAGSSILRQTKYSYFGDTGDLAEKSELVCPGTYANTSYTYDIYGNPKSVTDPMGIVTSFDYDPASETFPWRKVTGTLTNLTLYDPGTGNLLCSTNEQGMVTVNTYDGLWRPNTVSISTNANGAATLLRTSYSYVMVNVPVYVQVYKNDPASPTGWHETDTLFDGLARPIQVFDQGETNTAFFRVTSLWYDSHGQVQAQTYPTYSSFTTYYNSGGTVDGTYTQFDPIGRPFTFYPHAFVLWGNYSITPIPESGDANSTVGPTSICYQDNGNPWAVVVTNALGKIHKYILDSFGRTNQIVEVTSTGNYATKLAYNQVGDLTNITDNASNSIAMFYNLLGQRVAVADPDMGLWQYILDLDGRLKTQTDAKGQQIKLFYNDTAGRLTRREGWIGTSCVSTNTWSYDSNAGDTFCTVYPGQAYKITDDEGWQKFSNDVRNRTLKSIRYLTKNGNTYTNQFTFDAADRQTSILYPNGGPLITNRYDAGLHLKQVAFGTTNFYTVKGLNALEQLNGITFGNGVTTTLNYYPVSRRLQQIVTAKSANMQSLIYSHDANGNVLAVADGVYSGAASATMSSANYDDLDRLLSATWTSYGTKRYAYNPIGNVMTNGESGVSNYVYGSIRPHAVRNANGVWFTYDQNGNVVYRGGQRLDYDVNNRLYRVISTNGTATSFGYAADGSRLWEKSGTNVLQVWIGSNYEEKQGQILYHIYAGGRQVATFDKTGTNVYQYYHPDDLTSTSIQTDQNGNQVQNFLYSAFGQSRYTQNTNLFKVSRRYTGQVFDDGTGLYYYNFRYYDPALGRFTQPDDVIPNIFNPQSYNRYSYCANNPLRYTDPSGHVIETTVWQDLGTIFGSLLETSPQAADSSYASLRTAALGPTENIMPKMVAQGVEMAGTAAQTMAEQYVGGKVLKAGAAAIEKAGGAIAAKVANAGKGIEQTAKTAETQVASTATKELRRPYIRKDVRAAVESNAAKNEEGKFIDPNTKKPLEGKYDLGHKPGNEHWREKAQAEREGLTQKQFNNRMNNPNKLQVEDPSSNRSHKFEQP